MVVETPRVTALAFHPPRLLVYSMLFERVCKLVYADACLGLVPEMPSLPACPPYRLDRWLSLVVQSSCSILTVLKAQLRRGGCDLM